MLSSTFSALDNSKPGLFDATFPWIAGVQLYPVIPIAIVLLLFGMTGAGSYWFAPRWIPGRPSEPRHRAELLRLAPLVLLTPIIGLLAVGGVFRRSPGR